MGGLQRACLGGCFELWRRTYLVPRLWKSRKRSDTGQQMRGVQKHLLWAALLVAVSCSPATAQTSTTQFLPEIDAYFKVNPQMNLVFQAKETRETEQPTQAEIGPSLNFYLKPLLSLKRIGVFDPDSTKSRPLVMSIGYRYLSSPGKAPTNRMQPVVTIHLPIKAGLLFTDRNRADLDWSNGSFTWRYRNRSELERRLTIRSYHPAPYASAEFFYESQYQKWSTTALHAGCLFPAGKHFEFDSYYEHQNITGKSPNQQLNQIGLILNLYF